MAQLTDRLPLTEGTNRVYEGIQKPSAIGAIANFVAEAFDGYQQIRSDVAVAKARKKKEDEDAAQRAIAYEATGAPERAVQQTAAHNAQVIAGQGMVPALGDQIVQETVTGGGTDVVSDGQGGFLSVPVAPPAPVEGEMKQQAFRAMSIASAVEQGRMPSITVEAALNADFRRMREKYPEHTEFLLDMYEKMGVKRNLFTELQDAHDEREFNREQGQARIAEEAAFKKETIEAARIAYGEDSLQMDENQLFLAGLSIRKSAFDLDQAKKAADARLAEAQAGKIGRDEVEEDLNQTITRIVTNQSFTDSAQYIQMANRVADALMKNPNDPQFMQEFQALGVKANQLVDLSVTQSVNLAIAKGYTGDPEKLRTILKSNFEPIKALFQGDFSVVKVNQDALRSIETATKLSTAEALPLFTALQSAGLKPADMPGFMQGVDKSPKMQKALMEEIKGFSQDWGEDRASVRLSRIIKILRGETTLARMEPGEAAKIIPPLTTTTIENAKGYNAGKGQDPEAIMNGAGEIAVATRALGPSTGAALSVVASNGFANTNVRNALIKMVNDPNLEDKTALLATIQASRAASAHMLNNMRLQSSKINKEHPLRDFFQIGWDNKNAKYVLIKKDVRTQVKAGKGLSGEDAKFGRLADTTNTKIRREPPEDMRNFISAANLNLDNAIDLGRVDPSTPKATDLELRQWYGQNKPLPNNNKPIDLENEVEDMIETFGEQLDKGIREAGGAIELPAEMSNPAGYRAIAADIKTAAAAHGIPEQLAVSLIGKESSFTPGKKGPLITKGSHKGDRAMGLGQVMAKTAAAYGVTDRSKLTPQEELDLSFRILKDNYTKSGNWKDAVSMYFTGVPYEQAKREGRSDGFNSVIQYVEDIL